MFCETDKINGVSANYIMLGQVPPSGTGNGDIIMDTDTMLRASPKSPWTEAFDPLNRSKNNIGRGRSRHGMSVDSSHAKDSAAVSAAEAVRGGPRGAAIACHARRRRPREVVEREADDIIIV